ncbi:MAG: hypothetical protein ACREJ3_20525, partial [Polyangiaceae bacterium]
RPGHALPHAPNESTEVVTGWVTGKGLSDELRGMLGVGSPAKRAGLEKGHRWYRGEVRALLISAALALCGCPPSSGNGVLSEPVTTCTLVGQSCIFAPGKLGLCVERTGPCEGSGCIVCQSQH